MTLPERYCCCDLRLGVFIYGIVITLLTLGGIGYISYVCTTLEPWDTQLLNFLIAANCISFILLILKCGCLIAGVAMLTECFRKLQYPPITTHFSFNLNETLRYPAITVCRHPPYKTEVLMKYGILEKEVHQPATWETFKFHEYTLDQFFYEATYNYSEMISVAALDGSLNNTIVNTSFSLNYGRCFTISPELDSSKWGSQYGYLLHFVHRGQRLKLNDDFPGRTTGFHIFIQNEHEKFTEKSPQADVFKEYIYLKTDDAVKLSLRLSLFYQLPRIDKVCKQEHGYTKSKCVENSVNKLISERVGCSTPWIPNDALPRCRNYSQIEKIITYSTFEDYLEQFYKTTDCPIMCNPTRYTPFIHSIRPALPNGSLLKMYFSSNLFTSMQEVISYDFHTFISDMGGSLGFLLGLSVLGMLALFEECIAFLFELRCKLVARFKTYYISSDFMKHPYDPNYLKDVPVFTVDKR